MPFIALYIIKLSISLAMVYFFYVLLLRRLTFYNWNRWYLLGYSLLAFYMPFIDISPVVQQADWKGHALIYYIPVLENIPHQQVAYQQPFNYQAVFLYVFVAGALVLLARLLMQYLSYRNIRKSARLLYDDGVQLYQVDKPIAPFSFGKAIYINHQHLEQAELEKIVRHEFVHVQQKHSLDIIIGEFICILNWYNPFAWLIRRSIRQNLEFIADQQVLENGIDRKQYQYLLLKVTGNHHYGFTSPFNFSFLKKRIIMMNKIASARIHLCRFAFLLPLMAVSLLSFRSIARQQNAVQQTETAGKNTGAFIITKKAKTDAAISTEPARSVSANKDLMDAVVLEKVHSTLLVVNPDKKVIDDTIDQPFFVDASLKGPGNPYRQPAFDSIPLYVINGKVMPTGLNLFHIINPAAIEEITVLKDQSAIAIYGEKAAFGAVIIQTKKDFVLQDRIDSSRVIRLRGIEGPHARSSEPFQSTVRIRGTEDDDKLLYLVNGVELSPLEFEKLDLPGEDIDSITVIKNKDDLKAYGEKGKYGVIKIQLKKKQQP